MSISIDAEKVSEKFQCPFLIKKKNHSKVGIKENFLNLILEET